MSSTEKVVEVIEATGINLDHVLANMLLAAAETVGKATEFVVAEIPEVAQQALLYYWVSSFAIFFVGLGLTVVGAYTTIKFIKDKKDNPAILLYLCILIAGFITLLNNMAWLKIWLAPKLWLIEYAASIVK